VVREAIKLLSARGLVEEIPGKGTFVSAPNFSAVRRSLEICLSWHAEAAFENLVQLRQLIEVEIAGLAALHVTKKEISNLWDNVKEMESVLSDEGIERFTVLDRNFHAGLARATHNELFVMLFEAIAGVMVARWKKMYWDPDVRKSGLSFHKRILAAVERRDPQEARRTVRSNIEAFRRDVITHL
jgi:GntR family transcriptional repressor for pyruvate dehydrogenase complex